MAKKIEVVKQEENPIAAEVVEQSIVDIGAAMKRINSTRLNRKALVLLISRDSGQPLYSVENVLNSLDQLERTYLTPKQR